MSLQAWFGKKIVREIIQEKEKNFYGPDAVFQRCVGQKNKGEVEAVINELAASDVLKGNIRFSRLTKLAKLRAGIGVDAEELKFVTEHTVVGNGNDYKARDNEIAWLEPIQQFMRERNHDLEIASMDLSLWGLAAQIDSLLPAPRSYVVERTPLFLADPKGTGGEAVVLFLCARRMPGPPLATPDWWRLGLVPLGASNELLEGIHYGLQQVLNALTSQERFQLSWWLEPVWGERWFENGNIGGKCHSVNVPSACIAMAHRLGFKEQLTFPLLDEQSGATGWLNPASEEETGRAVVRLDDRPVFPVGAVLQKHAAGKSANLLSMVVPKDNENELAGKSDPKFYGVAKLGDAFELLLSAGMAVQELKKVMLGHNRGGAIGENGRLFAASALGDRKLFEQAETDQRLVTAFSKRDIRDNEIEKIPPGTYHKIPFGDPEPFFLGQPVWYAECQTRSSSSNQDRWMLGIEEGDPVEKGGQSVRSSPKFDGEKPDQSRARWVRVWKAESEEFKQLLAPTASADNLERHRLVQIATSSDLQWRRICLVCAAGLGKTANLRWLEWRINTARDYRDPNLAFFVELSEFARWKRSEQVLEAIKQRSRQMDSVLLSSAIDRMLRAGQVTFLLDSLDQATADSPIKALQSLVEGPWKNCRIWISGRPYAFREAQQSLQAMETTDSPWRFFRIGPLDEAEACQNIQMLAGTV